MNSPKEELFEVKIYLNADELTKARLLAQRDFHGDMNLVFRRLARALQPGPSGWKHPTDAARLAAQQAALQEAPVLAIGESVQQTPPKEDTPAHK